eukprot:Rhum_TRINITY_DN19186_c0_g1::Rhum_TRINITY_DN19186_c0_g1_i1::g.169474::m.169474
MRLLLDFLLRRHVNADILLLLRNVLLSLGALPRLPVLLLLELLLVLLLGRNLRHERLLLGSLLQRRHQVRHLPSVALLALRVLEGLDLLLHATHVLVHLSPHLLVQQRVVVHLRDRVLRVLFPRVDLFLRLDVRELRVLNALQERLLAVNLHFVRGDGSRSPHGLVRVVRVPEVGPVRELVRVLGNHLQRFAAEVLVPAVRTGLCSDVLREVERLAQVGRKLPCVVERLVAHLVVHGLHGSAVVEGLDVAGCSEELLVLEPLALNGLRHAVAASKVVAFAPPTAAGHVSLSDHPRGVVFLLVHVDFVVAGDFLVRGQTRRGGRIEGLRSITQQHRGRPHRGGLA